MKDVGFVRAIVVFFFFLKDGLDLIKVETYDNTIASVGIFSGFDDPRVMLVNVRVQLLFFHFLDILRNRIKIVEEL